MSTTKMASIYISDGKSYSHEDGSSHGDGVQWVEDGGEEMDVEARFKTESPQLGEI